MPAARASPSPPLDECREWLTDKLRVLQAKALTANLALPQSYKDRLAELNVHETGPGGEPILIMVLRFVDDAQSRQKYLKLLIEEKVNVNLVEPRDKRTALMIACVEEGMTAEGRLLMNAKGCNLTLQDRLGNTALMLCAMRGREQLMQDIVELLSKNWGLAALQLKNCMGYTAEDLALRNEHHRCARMVQSERLHMMSCLNRQMDMVGKVGCKQWTAFAALYRIRDKWKPRQRRKSEESLLNPLIEHRRKNSM